MRISLQLWSRYFHIILDPILRESQNLLLFPVMSDSIKPDPFLSRDSITQLQVAFERCDHLLSRQVFVLGYVATALRLHYGYGYGLSQSLSRHLIPSTALMFLIL
jgi:hypothetical protein